MAVSHTGRAVAIMRIAETQSGPRAVASARGVDS